jgi:hypothetical protein
MNKRFVFLSLSVLLLQLTGCPVEQEDEGPLISVTFPIKGDGRIHYYSLSTGQEVFGTAIASTAWDIAFDAHDNSFFIFTNSGDSAEAAASGGKGGVWFTDKTDFTSVARADAVTTNLGEYAPYTQDVTRYAMIMAAEPVKETLNVITYLGYPSGDGSLENYFHRKEPDQSGMASFVPYLFTKKQCFTMRGMPPTYTPTYQVYVIRHGDGVTHSKIQMNDVYLDIKNNEYYFVLKTRYERL